MSREAASASSDTRAVKLAGRRASALASLGLASVATAALLWCAHPGPLSTPAWAAAFLFVAVASDVRSRQIPNWWTLPAIAFFLVLATWSDGLPGLLRALGGTGVGFALLLPAFVVGALGAGDVKLVMGLGALRGASFLLEALPWMLVAGGVCAVIVMIRHGIATQTLSRIASALAASIATRRLVLPPPASSSAVRGIPFAVAAVAGACAHQLWGAPWE